MPLASVAIRINLIIILELYVILCNIIKFARSSPVKWTRHRYWPHAILCRLERGA